MADINQILTRIKNAIFGKDVRQAIHDGVKLAYDTASGIDGKATKAQSDAASALTAANSAKTTAEGIAGTANSALNVAQSANQTATIAKNTADSALQKADGALKELPNKIDVNFGGSTSYQKIVTYGPTPTGVSVSPLAVTELPATDYLPAAGYTIIGLSSSPRSNDSAVSKEYVDTRLDRKIESKWAGVLPYASTQLVMYDNEDGMIAGYVPNAKFGITVRNGGIENYTFALGNCGLDPESDDELVNYGFMKSYIDTAVTNKVTSATGPISQNLATVTRYVPITYYCDTLTPTPVFINRMTGESIGVRQLIATLMAVDRMASPSIRLVRNGRTNTYYLSKLSFNGTQIVQADFVAMYLEGAIMHFSAMYLSYDSNAATFSDRYVGTNPENA